MADNTYTLHIKKPGERAYQHGFHLGTIESTARFLTQDIFFSFQRRGEHLDYVILIQDGRVVDLFDGTWSKEATYV